MPCGSSGCGTRLGSVPWSVAGGTGKNQPQTIVLSDEVIVSADGATLAVELTNDANNHVIADKVTIERVN